MKATSVTIHGMGLVFTRVLDTLQEARCRHLCAPGTTLLSLPQVTQPALQPEYKGKEHLSPFIVPLAPKPQGSLKLS